MGRKAKFGDDGVVKQFKGPGRKSKKQKPPKMLPGLPKLNGKSIIIITSNFIYKNKTLNTFYIFFFFLFSFTLQMLDVGRYCKFLPIFLSYLILAISHRKK